MVVNYALDGATVVVTGGASGIGAGIAAAFAAQSARVVLVDRDAASLERSAAAYAGKDVHAIACDLNADADVARLAAAVAQRFGAINVLVNNAGVEYPTPLEGGTPDGLQRWGALLENNVVAMARVTQALLPHMRRGASIVNQSSIWGLTGVAGFSAYVASKHAVIGLTRSLAKELAPRGIRVNAVCPGWVRTESSLRSLASMAREAGRDEDDLLAEILSAQAFPELLEPSDIAGVYLFLASADARAITGQAIVASNGEVMH